MSNLDVYREADRYRIGKYTIPYIEGHNPFTTCYSKNNSFYTRSQCDGCKCVKSTPNIINHNVRDCLDAGN